MSQPFAAASAAALAALDRDRVLSRLWDRDHTVWREDPTEIANRLGWLDLPQTMRDHLPELDEVARETRDENVQDVVLCGMGGSSLGAEVLRAVAGRGPGFPRLFVVDSTVPDWVRRVRSMIDPARSLFLISSKSGGTAEVSSLFRYFWAETFAAVGPREAGQRFLAITDPGSSLATLAGERGFRHLFLNPPDVGGRFSVLSLFGLVPAALLGLDLRQLLARAGAMAVACGPELAAEKNPGAALGVAMAAGAQTGRPFLTLLADSRLAPFGLWAEQLVAESLGKEGVGVVPICGEPLRDADSYPDDRVFVRLRLAGERELELDRLAAALANDGRPVIEIALPAPEALGAEFFRWEYATAVAGHLLGVHPFDQPNVEETKRETRKLLDTFRTAGALPGVTAPDDLRAMLLASPAPTYVALLVYTDETDSDTALLQEIRWRIGRELGVPTTLGFGPRYLHSTGQMHKGGPDGGLFVQIVGLGDDLEIPGEPFGFATLARAQADGDLLALQGRGRRCVRLELGDDVAYRLAAIHQSLD